MIFLVYTVHDKSIGCIEKTNKSKKKYSAADMIFLI